MHWMDQLFWMDEIPEKEHMEYKDQLNDPRWQQARLYVFERDGFACTVCKNQSKTLHAHHKYYEKDTLVWEYPRESIVTVCADCHKAADELRVTLKREIGTLSLADCNMVLGYVRGMRLAHSHDRVFEANQPCEVMGAICGFSEFGFKQTQALIEGKTFPITITAKDINEALNEKA